jgi:hypothetical protein
MTTYGYCANNPVSHIDPDGRIVPILIPVIAGIVGGGLNLASNWSKINGDPLKALGYFASGAAGAVVSLSNPLAGGAITSTSNAAIDIVSGNVPQMKNFGDVVKYVGQEAAWGTATSLVGSQVGKVIGPQIAKLGKSVGGWFRNTFQAYAKESLQTVIINGEPVTTTIDVGIKATKQYVAKSLGSSAGSVAKGASGNAGNDVLNTNQIHFMQSSIKNSTGEFTVLGNAKALREGTLDPTKLTMNVWKDSQGKIWTLDHRRLAAFKLSGLDKAPVNWADPTSQMWKMTTNNGGTSIWLKLGNGNGITVK